MRKSILSILYLLLLITEVFASKPVILTDQLADYSIEYDQLEIFEDTNRKAIFEQISKPNFNKFKIGENEYPYAENENSIYWFRIKILNQSTQNKRWIFENYANNIQEFTIYIPNNKGSFSTTVTGTNFNFSKRDYDVINPAFDIPSNTDKAFYIYIKVNTRNHSSFDFHIKTQNYFTKYATKEYWFLGFYYGIIAYIIIYFSILFITSKDKLYLFYIFYLFSCAFSSLVDDGMGFEFIWANTPKFNEVLNNYLSSSLFLISFILYAKYFIGIGDKYPKWNTAILLSSLFCLSIQFFSFFDLLFTFCYFIPFLLIYIISFKAYLNGDKSIRYFIAGQTLLLISMIIFRLSWYGIIEANIISVYSFNISVVLEGLMFSYAFVDRFNLLKKQNEEAQLNVINQLEENKSLQTKVNRELEIKVQERTEDLKNESLKLVSANEKLEILMKQVNEMNSKLDFDNWQLNKKVTEEQKARVVSEQISYDEFTKVYPTEFSCLKYLEQLKWENDFYTCKKCANNKYIYLQKNLSRRCTKCSYIESATNGTIFQGLKFSITKAFYIVYYCTLDVQTMTVDELSDLLELRRNTCWSFRKRALEHKESIPKSSKSKDRNKFNSLILNVID